MVYCSSSSQLFANGFKLGKNEYPSRVLVNAAVQGEVILDNI